MGNFLYGGKRPTSITYQGKDVQTLKYNGVVVWSRLVAQAKTFVADNTGTNGATRTEIYFAPAGASVVWIKSYKDIGNNTATSPKGQVYSKIRDGQKFQIKTTTHVDGGNGYYYHSVNMDIMAISANGDVVRPSINFSEGSNTQKVRVRVDFVFSPEVNEHDFNDSTSDHTHLDWTK